MAIVFTFDESTNVVVVTGGTSGTPATFADFVHFDRTVGTSNSSIPGADVLGGLGDCATDWFDVQGDGWSYDGVADEYDCDGSQASSSLLIENTILTIGVTYKVIYTVKNYTENGAGDWIRVICGLSGFGTARYANGTYTEFITCGGDTHFRTQAGADFIGSVTDITIEPVPVSGAELKAATAVAADTDLTLTYPVRPVEHKALRLAITTAQNGGAAVSGDETVDIFGTTAVWQKLTGASASGQKVIPIADLTHNYQVGDTVILIDISAPGTYETDIIASISEGISITLTNNNTNSYATGDIVGIYQTEQIDTHTPGFGTVWTTVPYGQIAMLTFTGYDGTNTAKVDQPIWGVIWDYGNGLYRIANNCLFTIGNGGTATHFSSRKEHVVFTGNTGYFNSKANSVLYIGTKVGTDKALDRSFWTVTPTTNTRTPIQLLGKSLVYGWTLQQDDTDVSRFWPSFENSNNDDEYIDCRFITSLVNYYKGATIASKNEYVGQSNREAVKVYALTASISMANLTAHSSTYGLVMQSGNPSYSVTIDGLSVEDCTNHIHIENVSQPNANYYVINANSDVDWATLLWKSTTAQNLYRQYKCNVEVTDKDGVLLDGVTVLCKDEADVQVFSELTGATNTGEIDEQIITYIKYYYDSGANTTTYSPHKFTLSKAGYETLILENITVDSPIVWHLELQPATGSFEQKQWR